MDRSQRRSSRHPFTGAFLPLVGEGKHGPDADLVVAGDRDVVLRGHRIERYGKQLIEVTGETADSGAAVAEPGMAPPAQVALGRQLLRGEIVDSKCWFGVMNPALGKAHKDCAIRCISGGAPPAFVVRSAGADGRERTLVLLLAALPFSTRPQLKEPGLVETARADTDALTLAGADTVLEQ